MSLREKYLKLLSEIIPIGAIGASLLLGSTTPSAANDHPTGSQTSASDEVRVSERLAAIREAVSAVAKPESEAKPATRNLQLAWGNRWGNWGGAGAPLGVGVGRGTIGGVTGERGVEPREGARSLVPRVELLVVQPTPFCNIDCRYCYLQDRNSKAVVAPQTLVNLFSQAFASGWVQDCLTVVWHAGEPMVLPIGFYRNAFRMIDRLKPAGLSVAHSFQTNGTLIDEAWCAFFAEERVDVGVSVDQSTCMIAIG